MYKSVLNGYEAIIFDLDGTVVQDEDTWREAIRSIFEPEALNEDIYLGERGYRLRENIELVVKKNQLKSNVNEDTYYRLVVTEFFNNFKYIELTPGFLEFAEKLKASGKRMALVTNSDLAIAIEITKRLKIDHYFEFILSAEQVRNPKPLPDIYEEAVRRLNLPKKKILVFEDSPSGSFSAEEAGLNRIIILDSSLSKVDFGSRTRNFVDSFEFIVENYDIDSDEYIESLLQ